MHMRNYIATLLVLLCCALGYTPAQAGCSQMKIDVLKSDGLSKSEIQEYCNKADAREAAGMEKAETNKCATPQVNCTLAQKVPVGTPCSCSIPYGTANGKAQ